MVLNWFWAVLVAVLVAGLVAGLVVGLGVGLGAGLGAGLLAGHGLILAGLWLVLGWSWRLSLGWPFLRLAFP